MSIEADPRLAEGLRLFRAQEWFEAHEVIEGLWRSLSAGPDRSFAQGMIQLAVSLEHWRRHNPRGALGQWTKARGHLAGLPSVYAGVEVERLLGEFAAVYAELELERAVAAQRAGEAVHAWTTRPARWPTP